MSKVSFYNRKLFSLIAAGLLLFTNIKTTDAQGNENLITQLEYSIKYNKEKLATQNEALNLKTNILEMAKGMQVNTENKLKEIGLQSFRTEIIEVDGEMHLLIEMPKDEATQEIKNQIEKSILVEFKKPNKNSRILENEGENEKEAIMFNTIIDKQSPDLWENTEIKQSMIEDSGVAFTELGIPILSIKFDEEGTKKFEELTSELTGSELGIFINGELITAPKIMETIINGEAIIQGDFDIEELLDLASQIKKASTEARLELVEEREINAFSISPEITKYRVLKGLMELMMTLLH